MFKKIMLIILSACELFLCYLAFFKKDGSSGGAEQAAYGTELAERYMILSILLYTIISKKLDFLEHHQYSQSEAE